MSKFEFAFLLIAAIPFIYYGIAILSSIHYFWKARSRSSANPGFWPPVSILKPIRGLDPNAYENFASFCHQDYPEYEILFCTTDENDPAVRVIQEIIRDFPERRIRLLYSTGIQAINDKVAKLGLMTREARHEILVINDSDVYVEPDYLRTIVGALQHPNVGAVTCFYVSREDRTFADKLQSIGMLSDFYAGILVAWQLDGVHFALGPTMAASKERVRGFGGFEALESRPADDLLFGRLIAEQGFEVVLLRYTIKTEPDFAGMEGLLAKRSRWMTVMRNLRPWGHFGLMFTWGLPWSLLAILSHPTLVVAVAFGAAYLGLRTTMTMIVGAWGLRQRGLWMRLPLIPVWDAIAFIVWLGSFARKKIRWRGVDYELRNGHFVPPRDVSGNERRSEEGIRKTAAPETVRR